MVEDSQILVAVFWTAGDSIAWIAAPGAGRTDKSTDTISGKRVVVKGKIALVRASASQPVGKVHEVVDNHETDDQDNRRDINVADQRHYKTGPVPLRVDRPGHRSLVRSRVAGRAERGDIGGAGRGRGV